MPTCTAASRPRWAAPTRRSWKAGDNSTLNYAPRFFLINGRVFTGIDASGAAATDLPVAAANGSRIGLRIANAGLQSRTLMLTNGTWKLLGEDGYPYAAPREQATVLVPAGKTTDAQIIANVPATGVQPRAWRCSTAVAAPTTPTARPSAARWRVLRSPRRSGPRSSRSARRWSTKARASRCRCRAATSPAATR